MTNYNFMVQHLPNLYRRPETLKKYKVIGAVLDSLETLIDALPGYMMIDLAPEDFLNLIGENIGRYRKSGESVETYRQILKAKYHNVFLVPNLNNLLRMIKSVIGQYPRDIVPGWAWDTPEDLAYKIDYLLTPGFDPTALEEIESMVGAGIKLIAEYNFEFYQEIHTAGTINASETFPYTYTAPDFPV